MDKDDISPAELIDPTGLSALLDPSTLPLSRAGVMTRQVSSFDRQGGNENDGFTGTYSSLYEEDNRYVIFDSYGPGCVYMIWFTHFLHQNHPGDILFFIDGQETPLLDMSLRELFSGVTPAFPKSLVYDSSTSSGGLSSYVPIPFRNHLRIAMTSQPLFHHITYHRYRKGVEVDSFTGHEELNSLVNLFEGTGSLPDKKGDLVKHSGEVRISTSSTKHILHISSAGTIRGIRIRPSPRYPNAIQNTWLKVSWDNAETPQVNVPLGEFFGSGYHEVDVKALYIGMSKGGDYYCYFPMPFYDEAVMEIDNKGQEDISLEYEILLDKRRPPDNALLFHATWRSEYPTTEDKDYTILDTSGRGHLVGVNMTMRGPLNRNYLEGDIRVHLDGNRSPALHGTGTEDYFNGGWYFFNGTFSLPMHGNPLHVIEGDKDITGCYRLHIGDMITFENSIRFTIEHGPRNDIEADYSSVAYYYLSRDTRLILVDELDVGKKESESIHEYHIDGEKNPTGFIESFYEGEYDDIPYSDEGYIIRGTSQFILTIPPENKGVRLRKRTDQRQGGQRGEVIVNGESVGIWYIPLYNPYKRWLEAEYDIPPEYTEGHDKIVVGIRSLNPEVPWNEYYYWALAFSAE